MTDHADISSRLRELKEKAAGERAAAAEAVGRGEKPDFSDQDRTEREIQALEELEFRRQREARAEEESAWEKHFADLRISAVDTFTTYLHAQRQAEAAARELAASIRDVRSASAALTQIAKSMNVPSGIALGAGQVERRLSERLTAVLRLSIGHPARFGVVEFHGGQKRDADEDWASAERYVLEPAISTITTEKTNDNASQEN